MPINKKNNTSNDHILRELRAKERREEYQRVIDGVNDLCESLKMYYDVDSAGNSKPLFNKDYDFIINEYHTLQEACKKFIADSPEEKTSAEKKYMHIVNDINGNLSKDIDALTNSDRSTPASLSSVTGSRNISRINLNDRNIDLKDNTVIHLKNAKGTEGLFRVADPQNYKHNITGMAMAELLGHSKLYSKISVMKVSLKDKTVTGIFSTAIEGENPRNLDRHSPLRKTELKDFNNPAVLKQISDIQLVDYLCGNPKRHPENLAYHFEKGDDGKQHLKRVTAINDRQLTGKEPTDISDIKAISRSSYETLCQLSESTIRLKLANKLKPDEIDQVCKRANEVKKEVEKKKIMVVDENQWGIYPIQLIHLANGGVGLCYDLYSLHKELTMRKIDALGKEIAEAFYADEAYAQAVYEMSIGVRGGLFEGGKNISEEVYDNFTEQMGEISSMKEQLDNLGETDEKTSDKPTSPEYKAMCKAIRDVDEYTYWLNKKKTEFDTGITEAEYMVLQELSKDVSEKSLAYINSMKGSQLSDKDQKRLNFARTLGSVTPEDLEKVTGPLMENIEEKEKEEPELGPELTLEKSNPKFN